MILTFKTCVIIGIIGEHKKRIANKKEIIVVDIFSFKINFFLLINFTKKKFKNTIIQNEKINKVGGYDGIKRSRKNEAMLKSAIILSVEDEKTFLKFNKLYAKKTRVAEELIIKNEL